MHVKLSSKDLNFGLLALTPHTLHLTHQGCMVVKALLTYEGKG